MSIFAIADLHLSFSAEKPMDIYGGQWVNHVARVKENWERLVKAEDTVILPGDISWGMRLEEARADLAWLERLPGKKLCFRGNHDLWWNSVKKLNGLFESLTFVQNTAYEVEGYWICGSRGWLCPGEAGFTERDEKIYKRELGRLRLSLDAAPQTAKNRIGVLHYPPTNEQLSDSGFTDLFSLYGTEKVVYGHLHGKEGYKNGFQGRKQGVEYILTSCDKLQCVPLRLV